MSVCVREERARVRGVCYIIYVNDPGGGGGEKEGESERMMGEGMKDVDRDKSTVLKSLQP